MVVEGGFAFRGLRVAGGFDALEHVTVHAAVRTEARNAVPPEVNER